MEYGRLEPSSLPSSPPFQSPLHPNSHHHPVPPQPHTSRLKLILLTLLSITLIATSALSATLLIQMQINKSNNNTSSPKSLSSTFQPTKAISKICSKTRYPNLCVNSLLSFPPSSTASSQNDLVHISFNLTLQKFGRALYSTSDLSSLYMDQRVRSAYDDCLELLDDSIDALTRSLLSVSPNQNTNKQLKLKAQDCRWSQQSLKSCE